MLDVLDALDADLDVDLDVAAVATASDGVTAAGAPVSRRCEQQPAFCEARALIAVACADGPPNDAERRAVRRAVEVDGDVVWRAHRPTEVGVPASLLEGQRVLSRMVEIALADRDDGVLDESERALLQGFARAFGVDVVFVDDLVRAAAPPP